METNLSSRDVISWKESLDNAISRKLIVPLRQNDEIARNLMNYTLSGADETDLTHRFHDLGIVMDQAAIKLDAFRSNLVANLNLYVETLKAAESQAATELRKSIDQFAEAAEQISKISM